MLLRICIEGSLDGLALSGRRGTVIDGDAFLSAVGPLDQRVKLIEQVALGGVVLRKDDDANVGPVLTVLELFRANPLR